MISKLETVKHHYLSEQNNSFIMNVITQNYMKENVNKTHIFNIQNNIFNLFLQDSHTHQTFESAEEIIITLNKMTIKYYLDEQEEKNSIEKINTDTKRPDTQIADTKSTEPKIINDTKSTEPKIINDTKSTDTKSTDTKSTDTKFIDLKTHEITLKNAFTQTVLNEIKEINEVIKVNNGNKGNEINEIKLKPVERMYCISELCVYDTNTNTYTFEKIGKGNSIIDSLEIMNNLYNIPVQYKLEIMIDNNNYNVIVPIGNYTINDLVDYIQNQLDITFNKCQIRIKYNKMTHKITFESDNIFHLTFLEPSQKHVSLNYLLGFSNTNYKYNNKYNGDLCIQLHVFKRIYVHLEENECTSKVNNSQFSCLTHVNSNEFNKMSIHNINITTTLKEKMTYSFYYYANTRFYKITQKLQFQILCLL
jgi:hypothetical protein